MRVAKKTLSKNGGGGLSFQRGARLKRCNDNASSHVNGLKL